MNFGGNRMTKKIELHCHTKMSAGEGLIAPSELIRYAYDNGYAAVAVTDTGNVQAFGEACYTWKKLWKEYSGECEAKGMKAHREDFLKVIFGMEGMLLKEDGASFPVLLYAKNETGFRNLYRIVTESCLKHNEKGPKIPVSFLDEHREGLIIGAACDGGEAILAIENGEDDETVRNIMAFYDFLEIVPLKEWTDTLSRYAALGKQCGKRIAAASDAYYINEEDSVIFDILTEGMQTGKPYSERPRYLTDKEGFANAFAGECPEELVAEFYENSARIADEAGYVSPFRKGRFLPEYPDAAEKLTEICRKRLHEIYGEDVPEEADERLRTELRAICGNGFAPIFMIMYELVKKSHDLGYPTGVRGSVGSSFAAYLCGISPVNPLSRENGGFDIPAEVFFGLRFDKEPDIDLNVAPSVQELLQDYAGELPGVGDICIAGTVMTVREMRAKILVEKYFEKHGLPLPDGGTVKRFVEKITGVKTGNGQHPGGVILCPSGKELTSFTPLMYPDSGRRIVSHFSYYDFDLNLLKADVLQLKNFEVLHELQELTGISQDEIPLDDEKVLMKLCDPKKKKIKDIPEFGNRTVRRIIKLTKPKTLEDLMKISALVHGTDVWTDNQDRLFEEGKISISECIASRDDIMLTLMGKGMSKDKAFTIMEHVRKGRGVNEIEEAAMKEAGIPKWYIEACKKIRYLFPKAHAAAYTLMTYRLAWYLVYYPEAFEEAVITAG